MALSKIGTNSLEDLSVTSGKVANDGIGPNQLNEAANYAFTGTVTGIPVGLQEVDYWHKTSGQSISADTQTVASGNWSRTTTRGFSKIGTGMTESSGVFTFPSTGIYSIIYHPYWNGFGSNGASDANYCASNIQATINNSDYAGITAGVSIASSNINPKVRYVENNTEAVFDVTDTSTHKVRFNVYIEHENGTLSGSSNNITYAIFKKLGDT